MKSKTRLFWLIAIFAIIFSATLFIACSDGDDDSPPVQQQQKPPTETPPEPVINFTIEQEGGTPGSVSTTGIRFTFGQNVTGVDHTNIIVEDYHGEVVIPVGVVFTGSGNSWVLGNFPGGFHPPITVNAPGLIRVRINKAGVSSGWQMVRVHQAGTPTPDVFAVNWEPNGGIWGGTPPPTSILGGQTLAPPPAITRSGSFFAGWFDESFMVDRIFPINNVRSDLNIVAAWRSIVNHAHPVQPPTPAPPIGGGPPLFNSPAVAIGAAANPIGTHTFPSELWDAAPPPAFRAIIRNMGNRPTETLSIWLSGPNPDSFVLSNTGLVSISPADGHHYNHFTVRPASNLRIGTHIATVNVGGSVPNVIHSTAFEVRFTVHPNPALNTINISAGGDFGITETALEADVTAIRNAIHNMLASAGGVIVTGTRQFAHPFALNIPLNDTVRWTASLNRVTGPPGTTTLSLTGPGTLEICSGSITAGGDDGVAIRSTNTGLIDIMGIDAVTISSANTRGTEGTIVLAGNGGAGRRLRVADSANIKIVNTAGNPADRRAINVTCGQAVSAAATLDIVGGSANAATIDRIYFKGKHWTP